MSDIFRGLSAFPITPASADGIVDTDAVQMLVARLVSAEVASIGLLGSTGTYAYLDRTQRRRIVAAAAEVKGEVPLIVGVGALRTDAAVALAQDAEELGADGLLLAPVSYTPLTKDEAFLHYITVADATALPLCIYNNPGTTRFTFDIDLLQRLAAHPRIAAVKMPLPADGDIATDLDRLRAALPEDFVIGYSGDWGISAALTAGADAFYSALGGTLPNLFMALSEAARSQNAARTAALEDRLQPLWSLCRTHGSLRLAYALSERLGVCAASLPRPLLPMNDVALAELDRWLAGNGDLAS